MFRGQKKPPAPDVSIRGAQFYAVTNGSVLQHTSGEFRCFVPHRCLELISVSN